MPRRLVTSEFFRNEKIADLDITGRLFFIGLITNADDDGRVRGSPKYLKASIFPYDDINIATITKYCTDCQDLGIIHCYKLNGADFIYLTGWQGHQTIRADRYKPSTLPPPDNQEVTTLTPPDNQEVTTGMLNISKVNISKVNIIYTVWNEQGIITHQKLTNDISSVISSVLKDYGEAQILQSIKNYAEILKDGKYYFKYKWTLRDFLKRGLPKFLDIDIAKNNYSKDIKNGTHKGPIANRPATKEDFNNPESKAERRRIDEKFTDR